ncbi:MAG TPA: cell surface protein SprA [Mucilaginibacter sp.]|nr:cell surface protein SprA [Mucilaginibacter sp.]
MIRFFTWRDIVSVLFLSAFCGLGGAFAQQQPSGVKKDSVTVKIPVNTTDPKNYRLREGIFDADPPNLVRTIEYDAITNRYILYERVGNLLYRPPQYLTFEEYLKIKGRENQRNYFKQLSDSYGYQSQQPGFMLQTQVRSETFNQIFGGSNIDIKPQGSAEAILSGQVNNNQNPLFNTRQRSQFNFTFDQKIQLNVTGTIGDKLKIATNYNTDAQFQFENQIKLDYTGHPDEIIQKIEAGTVSMPLNTTLITGSQALFGVKTKLKFGRLDITSILSQQRSQSKTITISNNGQQGQFRLTSADYEANKHYFLSQYFRNNYDRALANIPIISSNIHITKIEVWTTNRTNVTTDSRDVLGLMDLGENAPYNTSLIQGGAGFSALPAGFRGPGFTQQSNSLLQNLPANARLTNDPQNTIATYFAGTGRADNYAKLTYARKLTNKEFTLQPQLGYISLNFPLNNDEVLAVAYQYTYNGVQYQVGEFSSDVPVDPATPKVLYVKLLKNQLLKTNLPTWKLMMKNIYSLNAFQISPTNFRLTITRLDDKTGIEKTIMEEGQNTKSKLWLQLTDLDNLDQQQNKQPDGYFDFLEGITVDSNNGRIMFPVLEPFGSDLARQFTPTETDLNKRYVYQPLYDSTKTIAQQFFPQLNRYLIKGTYTASGGSEYQLNAVNIPQGSVIVNAGSLKLTEGTDYTIDYNAGRIRILNQALLSSGQPINVKLENNELFGIQQKSLYGSRFDYHVSDNLNLGATIMHLTEQPITQNEIVGQESISNTIYGFDANYSSNSRFLTRLVDKLPFIHTKVPSSLNFNGEFARLLPGSPSVLSFAGSKNGTSYLDDFENSQSVIDVKSPSGWQISGTPQMPQFPEAQRFNDLSYGFNRARLAFYTIDPIFYTGGTIPVNTNELSNHYVRQVLETEVFPYKQSPTGQPLPISTLDLAFYPNVRGPYNYTTTGINPDGTLQNPQSRWGGMFRGISANDFESLNVEYIEFWVLDPYIYKPNSAGGDLYFNLGNISEDILKDGRKSLENGLPPDGNLANVDETVWGRVAKLQPVVNAFDNNPASRSLQDVGLDGLNDADERVKFASVIQQAKALLNGAAANSLAADPSSDDYQYYQGPELDRAGAGILKRYSRYNGTEGNSPTSQQSLALLGLQTSASTALPDGEDINRDNNMDQDDQYFQYKVSMRPQDLVVGKNFVSDKITSKVKLANGTTQTATWYQFRVPINAYQSTVGGIQDFKSIRYMRMFMTNFADTAVLRFATMQLVRGEWRAFNTENNPANVIADPSIINPPLDNSTIDVQAVNIEENGSRVPIPYVVPPGIQRQTNFNNLQANTKLNEQSLSLVVTSLRDGYSRAAFRLFNNDLRKYKRLQMFIHAEGSQLKDKDISAFVRLGADYIDNYYEYEIPLNITRPGTSDPAAIWPAGNDLDLQLTLLTNTKVARNNAKFNGKPWPLNLPFTLSDGLNKITIVGQPDLSRLTTVMLGVRNPLRTPATASTDDGLDKSGTVWFDELRLTDFDQSGGWAAVGRVNAKLADLADITIAGNRTTSGFGALDSRIGDRSLNDIVGYDISGNIELGKFFPDKSGIHIPAYVNVSTQVSTPQYDPASPDVLLKQSLNAAPTTQKRDSIQNAAEDYTRRKSFNLTNVHKAKTDPKATNHVWDIENWNATVAFTDYIHHDFTTLNALEKTYRVALAYNYTSQPRYYSPFSKIIKNNLLALIRDINYSLLPSRLNYAISFDRYYSENTLRNNDPTQIVPIPTTFNKTFNITRVYGIGWNLTRSLSMDIDATNLSTVDEPYGRLDGLKIDTLWRNILNLGRTTNYNHTMNFNYTAPLNKIPGMDWTSLIAHYSTQFTWQSQPLFAINTPQYNVGNSIQNRRTIQVNPSLNFGTLYNKFSFIKKAMSADNSDGLTKFLTGLLTSIKSVSGSYTLTQGTFIPGYLPKSNLLGEDLTYNSPGVGFLLGSQADLRQTAITHGWISTDTLQNQPYVTIRNEDLRLKSSIEPIKDLRIELSAFKTQDHTYQTNFKSVDGSNNIQNLSPVTSGDYSISYLTIGTAFSKINGVDNTSATFQKFMDYRAVISQRLGSLNPNSAGPPTGGYADGYGPNSQNVLVPAFLAAYTGKNASTAGLSQFPSIPIPNWQLTYNGLSRIPLFSDWFDSFDLKHGYRSSYTVGNFSTLLQYQEANGAVSSRDANNDFLPYYQFSEVTIFEEFTPLIGFDARFKNNMTTNFEYRRSRALSLSVLNSQLSQQNENVLVFGFGYHTKSFRFPFGWFNDSRNNDVNFKLDFSLRDNKVLVYRADVQAAEISSGAQNITVRPSIDYVINQRFNLNLFYDSNITRPYTSQTFNTAFTNFGINLKLMLQ